MKKNFVKILVMKKNFVKILVMKKNLADRTPISPPLAYATGGHLQDKAVLQHGVT